ncbi:MAG: exodeoxyribonuclease V subunit beta [Pseudomonadota bacterium]
MTPFDPLSVPLTGTHLIEASAGTGKTFAIASLFLRLVVTAGVPVDKILVVTFTQSATAELRDRIRRRLSSALLELRSGNARDELVAALVADPDTAVMAAARLSAALADFDRAPILTIHGFCNRILQDHAFETGMVFDAQLVTDIGLYRLMVADDFWRRHVMTLPPLAARCVQVTIHSPETLLEVDRRSIGPTVTVIPPPEVPLPETDLNQMMSAYRLLKQDWQRHRQEILTLLEDPALNGTVFGAVKPAPQRPDRTLRQIRLAARADAIDAHLTLDIPDLCFPKALSQLTTEAIIHYTRKGQIPPVHPFFDRCAGTLAQAEALNAAMSAFAVDLRYRFSRHLDEALDRLKARDHVLFYDDLLLRVYRALEAAQTGEDALIRSIRDQYQCALVDEFQDTDGLQYRIFSRLFHDPATLLFMIGDPKQAIYAFRGADIFSYLEASRKAAGVFTLEKNWRSVPSLVSAVNALFSQQSSPFVMTGLTYAQVVAQKADADSPFGDAPAMIVWQLPPAPDDSPDRRLSAGAAGEIAAAAVAAEIVHLTYADGRTLARAPVPLADMAVLVRTNAQARTIRRHLVGCGIPCVLQSSDSVFNTTEATMLWQVLHCLASPHATTVLRTALTTALMGVDLTHIGLPEDDDDHALARYRDLLNRLGQLWAARGFMRMFTELLAAFDTRRRFLAFADGPRKMTNLRHLAELIHGAEGSGLSPKETVAWLSGRITDGDGGDEAAQLRLETDAGAVTIVTVHKSKGLEYPVVFCPFLWRDALRANDPVYYHDPANDYRETVDFGSSRIEAGRRQALAETFAENLRLVYVALTRAKHRCYFPWDQRLPADGSALAYLIHGCAPPGDILPDSGNARFEGPFSVLPHERFAEDLNALERRSAGAIQRSPAPSPVPGAVYRRPAQASGALHPRVFSARIAEGGRVVSYTGLTAGSDHGNHPEGADHDGVVASRPAAPISTETADMAVFPRGATAGSLFHEIMESIDYRYPESPATARTVVRVLGDYGYDPGWQDALCRCVAKVLRAPLPLHGVRAPLVDLSPADRMCEMAFTFPLKRLAPADLKAVFAESGVFDGDPNVERWPDRLRFSPVHGHMKGFIDLWFRHEGRFYILDWKTNYLGPSPADYSGPNVASAMLQGDYHLQYHLYVLALHLYLKWRLAGYRYDRHFGGAIYLFVRGMDPHRSPGAGIFTHCPDPAVMHALEARLVDRERMIAA